MVLSWPGKLIVGVPYGPNVEQKYTRNVRNRNVVVDTSDVDADLQDVTRSNPTSQKLVDDVPESQVFDTERSQVKKRSNLPRKPSPRKSKLAKEHDRSGVKCVGRGTIVQVCVAVSNDFLMFFHN